MSRDKNDDKNDDNSGEQAEGSGSTSQYEFELQPLSWSKRRALDAPRREVTAFKVSDFQLQEGHYCQVQVSFANHASESLRGRVYANKTHRLIDGQLSEVITSWGVQAINADGVNIVLRLSSPADTADT